MPVRATKWRRHQSGIIEQINFGLFSGQESSHHRSKGERGACTFVTLDRTGCGALSRRRRGRWDDQVAGCATPLMTSRSAVSVLPLVSGPSSTEITTRTRKSIVLIIIGMAKPKFICTAR